MEGSAARARALGLCAHVPNRPSAITSTKGKTTLHRVRDPLAQCQAYGYPIARANRVFLYTSVSNQVSEQISYRWFPAVSRVDKRPSATRRFEKPKTVWVSQTPPLVTRIADMGILRASALAFRFMSACCASAFKLVKLSRTVFHKTSRLIRS